ncbi:GM25518 [Drosophila sechellia]|uniref:GM25518 n=1 Tax=Drosophila sechellia TaxID=7238 RepID=B4HI66_DROSE|nr:GM25518 [Drosophila sechellia]
MGLGLLPSTNPVIIIITITITTSPSTTSKPGPNGNRRGADRAVGMVGTDIYDKVETLTYCQPINEPTRAALDLSSLRTLTPHKSKFVCSLSYRDHVASEAVDAAEKCGEVAEDA